jgi:hypothetical protein
MATTLGFSKWTPLLVINYYIYLCNMYIAAAAAAAAVVVVVVVVIV